MLSGVLDREIKIEELGLDEIIYLLENHSNVMKKNENGDMSIDIIQLAKATKILIHKITDIKETEAKKISATDLLEIARKVKEVNEGFLEMFSELMDEFFPKTPQDKPNSEEAQTP